MDTSENTKIEKTPAQTEEAADALSRPKMIALEALRAQHGLAEAAAKAGVDRSTLYRWRRSDPLFRAKLNAWSQEQTESARLRILGGLDGMVEKLVWKAQNGWDGIAMKFVQGMGVIKPVTGSESAKRVKQEIDLELRQQQVQLAEQRAELREKQLEQLERQLKRVVSRTLKGNQGDSSLTYGPSISHSVL